MPSFLELSFQDYSREISRSRFQGVSVGSVNYDAQIALQDALETAVLGITLCTVNTRRRIASQAIVSSTAPTSEYAQREDKWLVVYHDDVTGKKYRVEIPGPDRTLLMANSDFMDLESTEGAAFKTAFENYVKQGEVADNAVVVDYVKFVGRNL